MPKRKQWQVAAFLVIWAAGVFVVICLHQEHWTSWEGAATAWWLGFLWSLLILAVVGIIEHRRFNEWWRKAKWRSKHLREGGNST